MDKTPLLTPGELNGYGRCWYGGLGVPDGWDAYGRLAQNDEDREGRPSHIWPRRHRTKSENNRNFRRRASWRPPDYRPRTRKPKPPPPIVPAAPPPPPEPPPPPPPAWPPPAEWYHVGTAVKCYADNWQKVEMTRDEIIRHERYGMYTRSHFGYKQQDDHLWRWLNHHLRLWTNEHPMRIRS